MAKKKEVSSTALPQGGAKKKIPHDEIFKTAFDVFFRDLVELVEPELATTLDLAKAEVMTEDPFADFLEGQAQRADLVAKTPTREATKSW